MMTCKSKYLKFTLVLLLLAFSGCGGGGGATTVSLSADKTQAVASTQDKVIFTATVRDGNGQPLAGKTVNFNVPSGTYPYVSQAQTNANGTAEINLKYPPVGPNTLSGAKARNRKESKP